MENWWDSSVWKGKKVKKKEAINALNQGYANCDCDTLRDKLENTLEFSTHDYFFLSL